MTKAKNTDVELVNVPADYIPITRDGVLYTCSGYSPKTTPPGMCQGNTVGKDIIEISYDIDKDEETFQCKLCGNIFTV